MMEKIETTVAANQERIAEDLHNMMIRAMTPDKVFETNDKMVAFSHVLRGKYPNVTSYYLFHILIGSTAPKNLTLFDFPGEDSVEKFILENYN